MNKTKPTLAQQTYEKVCAIETILNRLLVDSSLPVSDPLVPERPLDPFPKKRTQSRIKKPNKMQR